MKKAIIIIASIITLIVYNKEIESWYKSLTGTDVYGMYINPQQGIYHSIEIKGKTSCVVKDGLVGLPFATSYERDGDIIRIKTDQSDLMFTIKDPNTLIGEGFAKGTYRRVQE